jgi:hypothetical protein
MSHARNQIACSLRRFASPRRPFSPGVLLACLVAIAGAARQAPAEDDVLKLVPDKALGFAIVNHPESADAKLQQLGKQMNLPMQHSLFGMLEDFGYGKGLDKKRPVALLVLPPKEDAPIPPVIVLVPVTNYATFLQPLKVNETEAGISKVDLWGSPSLVRKIGSYAAISGEPFREELASLKPADEVPESLAQWQAWLAKKDAAAVVFAPGIKMLSEKAQQGIAMGKAVMAQAGDQGKQAAAALDMYEAFFKTAEKEVNSVGFSIERNKAGVIRLSKRARLVSGGSWANFFSASKPAEQNVLAGLPAGPFVFAGGGPLSEESMSKMMDVSFSMIKNMREMYGLTEEQAAAFSELGKKKFPGIHGFSFVLGVGGGDESIFNRMLLLMRVDDGKKFLSAYEEYMAGYNKVVEKANSPLFQPIKCEKTELDGAGALKVTVGIPKLPNMPPNTDKILEAMYGSGGKIVAWIVPCDEHSVIFSYGSKEHVLKAIAAVKEGKPGLADDAKVAKAAALLPKSASWRFFCSPKGVLNFGKRVMTAVMPAGANMNVPEFGETSPVAMALKTGEDEVEFQVVVPVDVIKEIGRLIGQRGNSGTLEFEKSTSSRRSAD